jgi:hypothetical protein
MEGVGLIALIVVIADATGGNKNKYSAASPTNLAPVTATPATQAPVTAALKICGQNLVHHRTPKMPSRTQPDPPCATGASSWPQPSSR